ncbi:expressed unknown protein [Seminavis robusta]|uniref:Uncharacterized protein n=1 Tax=Seminavis robusta TaxID=568900 RepID=A0A9N8DDQ6_9STRA|nr:expressed unknown protein [Seminavis robusta]|eukprot:Sro91_g047840.1 n/a (122) ;mRNA; f:102149-102514
MSDPLERFLRDLLRENNAGDVTIADDNASTQTPLPMLRHLSASVSSDLSMSISSLQENSSTSLDSMLSSSGSRWDSIPSIGNQKPKKERIPCMPRRSLDRESDAVAVVVVAAKENDHQDAA